MIKKTYGILVCLLLLGTFLFVIPNTTAKDVWWNNAWQYRKTITIDHTKVAATFSNFPVLLSISSDADLAHHAQNNGDDIVFIDSMGTMKYNHEIEKYDSSTGELVAWVNIPSISAAQDTMVYLYYGNPQCENQQNAEGTWDSNNKIVQHLEEPYGTLYDSSSYHNDGTNHGPATPTSAKIDGGYMFDGEDDYIDIPHSSSLNFAEKITIEGWFYLAALQQYTPFLRKGVSLPEDINEDGIVNDKDVSLVNDHWSPVTPLNPPYPRWDVNGDGYTNQVDLGMVLSKTGETSPLWFMQIVENKIVFSLSGTSNPQLSSKKMFTSEDTDKWYHFAAVYDGSTSLFYINGELDNSTSNTGAISTITTALKIGSDTSRYYFKGKVDEIRVFNRARSASWIKACYINQQAPSTFIYVGSEELLSSYSGQLVMSTPSSILEGTSFTVRITANDQPIEQARVTFNSNMYTTNTIGEVSLTAPYVDATKEYMIIASKDGYTSALETITIEDSLTPLQLRIRAPSTVTEEETFAVTVTALGNSIDLVAVTFNGITYYTSTNGMVSLKAPPVAADTDYTITARKAGYLDDDVVIIVKNQESAKGWIYGSVSKSDGSYISKATVCIILSTEDHTISSICTLTKEGYYSMYIPPGTYNIQVIKSGYLPYKATVAVMANQATQHDAILTEDPHAASEEESKIAADHTLQTVIQSGYVGATITVSTGEEHIAYYSDSFNITIAEAKPGSITFTVDAEQGTHGTFIFLYLGKDILPSTKEFTVTHDGLKIQKMPLSYLLDPQERNNTSGYVILSTLEGSYVGVYLPHFSVHTITISSLVETVAWLTMITVYIVCSVMAGMILFSPRFRDSIRLKMLFRKNR